MSEHEIDYESEASKQGWRPQDEWKGPPEQWKDAKQFVEDGKNILPLVQKKASDLEHKVEELTQRVESLTHSNAELNKMSQRQIEKEKNEKESLRAELAEMRKKAITEGDGDAFERADKQIRELDDDPTMPEAPLPPGGKEFLERNPWFDTNEDLTAYANGIADKIANKGFTGAAYFAELERRVKARFPEEFENPKKKEPSTVEDGGQREVSEGKRTFENLPPEAKAAFKQFEKDIPGFTKEQYLEQYEWE